MPIEEGSAFKLLTDYAVLMNVVSLRYDLCVPSLCTKDDIQKIVTFISKSIDFRGRVSRCETQPETPTRFNLPQLIAVSALLCCLILFLDSSILSSLLLACKCKGTLSKLCYNLSWQHSLREIQHFASYQQSHLKAPVLYGIRYIVLFWIMLVHTAAIVNFQFLRDLLPLKDLAFSQPAQILTKSSVQMDSLILITAFTMGFVCEGERLSKIARYVFRKFFRLMPAIMIVVALMVILPLSKNLLDGGATWDDIIPKPARACEKTGFFNFLLIQNFIHPSISCLPHTWLFCVEIQLALIFIPILALRPKYSHISNAILVACIVIGYIINVLTVSHLELPPTFLLSLPDQEQRDYYFNVHYFKPWTHLSTFACGILAGCFVAKLRREKQQKRERSPNVHYSKDASAPFVSAAYLFGWIICLCTLVSVIFSYNDWIKGDLPDALSSGFYDASQRVSWSLAQCYILYYLICVVSENSFIVRLLSNKVFIFAGRLSLLAYVIHPVWQLVFLSTQHTQIYSSKFIAVYSMMGNIIVSYILASIIAVLLEIPLCSLLVARDLVSNKHPIRPLLGKMINKSNPNAKHNQLNMYTLDEAVTSQTNEAQTNNIGFGSFKYQTNNNNTMQPNHNELSKENYRF